MFCLLDFLNSVMLMEYFVEYKVRDEADDVGFFCFCFFSSSLHQAVC